ncbi:hypothetical protein P0D88_51410, partial [Paraburkholderia sp. RL18-103-BIB-C]|uniref:hypothetical protein n=1 Tax=Paraburkholderia sp. RL18-103-BIB-C TaxID=3031637 RepID=UPI0038BA1CBE
RFQSIGLTGAPTVENRKIGAEMNSFQFGSPDLPGARSFPLVGNDFRDKCDSGNRRRGGT